MTVRDKTTPCLGAS